MREGEIIDDACIEAIVHCKERATIRIQTLRLPDSVAPLGIERTTLPDGPTGPPVILVHGLAQNRFTWRLSERSMAAWLAIRGYEVLNLELRGHGRSRQFGAGNAQSLHEYVDDLVRVVEACREPPFAIGHSLGGAVVVAASTRTHLAGVVHLAGVYTFASDNRFLRGLARLTTALSPVLSLPRVRVDTGWAGTLIARLYSVTDILGYAAPLAGWVPGSIERHLLEERLQNGFDWTSVEVWLHMSRWASGEPFDYDPAFRATDVPLLVLTGDQDSLARPADGQACFDASGSADRTVVHFDAFNHQVHWGHVDLILGRKAPEVVWPVIGDWLDTRS